MSLASRQPDYGVLLQDPEELTHLLFKTHHYIDLCGSPALYWKVKVLVSELCPTLGDPMDCSPPGSSVHRILQARMLEWVAISSSRGSSLPRTWTQVSCIAGRFFTVWATREASFVLNSGLFLGVQRWINCGCLLKKSAYFAQFGCFGIAGHDSRWKPWKRSFDFLQQTLSNNSCIANLSSGLQDTLYNDKTSPQTVMQIVVFSSYFFKEPFL